MPREWEERSGVLFYWQYVTETAREGQVFWQLMLMAQHETDDTERPMRSDEFRRYDAVSKVSGRELCSCRAISTEIVMEARPGEMLLGYFRRMGTSHEETAPDGVFLQDFGIFYYSDRRGEDHAPSY